MGARLAVNQKEWQWGHRPSRRGHKMHMAVVQKPAVWPPLGTSFMPDCTIIAVFRAFVLGILTLFVILPCIYGVKEKSETMTLCTMWTAVSEKMLSLLSS